MASEALLLFRLATDSSIQPDDGFSNSEKAEKEKGEKNQL
jgi:hypothetical protein